MSAFWQRHLLHRKVAVSDTHLQWARCPLYGAALLACLMVPSVAAQTMPSGQAISLQEVLTDTVGTENWVRFRFVAEGIRRTDDYEQTANDMTHLCETTALPYLREYDLTGDVIVISIADRPTAFGEADPDATQFFEAFRATGSTCTWEGL